MKTGYSNLLREEKTPFQTCPHPPLKEGEVVGPKIFRTYMQERWFGVLEAAVEADPRGLQGVADRLGRGCGRTALSLILSGAAQPGKVARRVLEVYDAYRCPVPTCPHQTCPHQPLKEGDPA